METLEAVKHSKATLEAQLNTQRSLIENMRVELAGAKVRRRQSARVCVVSHCACFCMRPSGGRHSGARCQCVWGGCRSVNC
jgi:hypothetical protein